MSGNGHIPVLLEESVEALNVAPDGHYVDGTYGRGGHSRRILKSLGSNGRLTAFDKDPEAARESLSLSDDSRFAFVLGSFVMMDDVIAERQLDGVLLDLGVSSPQLDDPSRGFGFRDNGPLDMRMNSQEGITAAEWLAEAPETEISEVIKTYGEERFARRMAAAIISARRERAIETTGQLATIVAEANPKWEPNKHPATRAFQAIRIFINRELDDLELLLSTVVSKLVIGGRLVVISFHSLEDRIVKRFMRNEARGVSLPRHLPVVDSDLQKSLALVGKAVKPSAREIEANPRSRSAIMRVAERLA
ncbi:MAG: 16S rRNA (cytosine(1402)-N(4))-methyltransferase [Cellvibrionales bacterium TMED21]|mgnify:FL=1|nr:16S rRNA (cytosine(1402)-N(4))-methyltransferase [Halieaceae bacterium]OUT65739.1 MAG: 16S rRNA (cytosine(1402)-N(4))-methyltransferase [Cellvibrionales bacterium TMED21]